MVITGICYTQSGNVKRYENKVSISLVKGTHDLPTLINNTTEVNKYQFNVSSAYIYSSKGNIDNSMPLIFVTYYPSSGKNPCYFNFAYNSHKITFYLYLLTPNTSGSNATNVFNKIRYIKNGIEQTENLDINSKLEIYVNDSDEIIFPDNIYKSIYNISELINKDNYHAINYGLDKYNASLYYYNTDTNVIENMFTLYHKLNGVPHISDTPYHDISINNVTKDTIAYIYVVPHYIYVHPIHAGYSKDGDPDKTDWIWEDTENSSNDKWTQYKISCSGRKSDTGGNYDRGPWDAPAADGGNRTNFQYVSKPVGCVRSGENSATVQNWYNYHLGVTLTTSLYEYDPYFRTVYRSTYTNSDNAKYFAYNGVCDGYLETLNRSPRPTSTYWGDNSNVQRYIKPYNDIIPDDAKRGNMGITYATQFPQNNTYIALDRTNPDNSNREAATTMPPQFWIYDKIFYWNTFVGTSLAPPMILQGLICGGSGNDKNHEALGLFSAISLKGKNKNPSELMFQAEAYNTYWDPDSGSQSGNVTRNQPYNSYIITGRIKNGGRRGCEIPIWQKFRFNVFDNIENWMEEYG